MRIATWNVNSIKQRLEAVTTWLGDAEPDVVCLQEIKCTDEAFPREAFLDCGYNALVHGQKGFNGVAILSRRPVEDAWTGLPGDDEDTHSRYIEGVISTADGVVRVASIYLPNGNPSDSPKYPYKLAWMDRLIAHARDRLALEEPLVLAGDYNVIADERDVYDPASWTDDALFRPETRAQFRRLLDLGLTDALRACSDEAGLYTFWDYQAGAWQRNKGLHIDHLLLSPEAADRLAAVHIDKAVRAREKPSDHVPVVVDLAIDVE